MAINTTFVTEKNFDSPDLFSSLTKDSIADIFTDPNSDTVASMRERMHTDGSTMLQKTGVGSLAQKMLTRPRCLMHGNVCWRMD